MATRVICRRAKVIERRRRVRYEFRDCGWVVGVKWPARWVVHGLFLGDAVRRGWDSSSRCPGGRESERVSLEMLVMVDVLWRDILAGAVAGALCCLSWVLLGLS